MTQLPFGWFVAGSLVLYFLIGIKFYLLDRWIGVPLRTGCYRMFHKENLPVSQRRGFIHLRTARVKMFWAGVISFATSVAFVTVMQTNPLVEAASYIFDTTLVFFGFMAGPWIWKTVKGKNRVLTAIDEGHDKLVSGELAHEAKEKLAGLGEKIRSSVDEVTEHLTGSRPLGTQETHQIPASVPNAPEPAPASSEEENRREAREMIERFTQRP